MRSHSPERPIVACQAGLRSRAARAALETGQAEERVDVVGACVGKILLVCHFHDGAVEAVRMADGVEALLAQALI